MNKYLEKSRLEAMADAVYAILMTLLILNIDVSEISGKVQTEGLSSALWDLMPEFWGFAVGFILTAIFWLAHYKQFRHVEKVTEGLVWLNILGLLFTTLIPFSTSLMTEYDSVVSDLFFSINIMIVGLINVWQWHYIRKNNLLYKDVDKKLVQAVFWKNMVLPIVTVVVIGLSLMNVDWSMVGFFLIPIIFAVLFRK